MEILKLGTKQIKELWHRVFGTKWTVESFDPDRKQQGITYEIKREDVADYKCSCQSFTYLSGTRGVLLPEFDDGEDVKIPVTCKHIRWILEQEHIPYTVI